ncbi:hypothetical protein [Paraglaciecola sp. 2405UD69-4]|uniref:hypothetical protein n=1 Tax=Paraglaciecola sp. 2405UD69-4 TaxID=3391836 RepID=UPI0039C9ABEC
MADFIDSEESNSSPPNKRRKPARVSSDMVAPSANLEPLKIEDMVLVSETKGRSHFKRLKYNGCPSRLNGGHPHKLLDMNRDDFVRQMYRLFKPNFNATWKTHFDNLCRYIAWLDTTKQRSIDGDYFHNDLVKLYMQQWDTWVKQNKFSIATWMVSKALFSAIYKAQGRYDDAKRLPSIKGLQKGANPHKGLHVESELKPTAKALFRGFKALALHIEEDSVPSINPIWDEKLLNLQAEIHGWSSVQRGRKVNAFKGSVVSSKGNWRNQLTRIAIMLCFMLTGMNTTPMLKMKRKDVKFKQIQGGKYIFEAGKDRAQYLEIDNAIGFSKYSKEFIERWLTLSAKISGFDDDAPLFPFIKPSGRIVSFHLISDSPQTSINKLLRYLGLTTITSSILRKTKLDTLQKVTEDIYLVSIAANNSIKTIAKSYSAGLDQDHQLNLAAAMAAKYEIVKGRPIENAICEAKHNYHDVISDFDYKRLRSMEQANKESLTPTGARCLDNKQGAAKLIDEALKRSGINILSEESVCTDFLACFECDYHALVAAVNDIWLMLSFKDTLVEMKQYPSVNSLPKSRYENLCLTIDSILMRFKEVSEKNFQQALEQKKTASHPLYSTPHSLNDLLDLFS